MFNQEVGNGKFILKVNNKINIKEIIMWEFVCARVIESILFSVIILLEYNCFMHFVCYLNMSIFLRMYVYVCLEVIIIVVLKKVLFYLFFHKFFLGFSYFVGDFVLIFYLKLVFKAFK